MRIGIVGSMQHTEAMLALRDQLRGMGHDVYVSRFAEEFIGKSEAEIEEIKLEQKFHRDAIRDYWHQMQGGDAILVANLEKDGIPNYIGGNTLMEIGFPHVLGQRIFLLNPIPDIAYYRTEIEAVRPLILNGELSAIAST